MKTLGKVAGIIGLLIVIAFAGSIAKIIVKSTVKKYEQGKADRTVEEILIKITKKINSQLPIMVDPDIRLDTVICYGKQMHYKYTMINYSENESNKKAFQNEATSTLAKNHCNNKNTVKMLKMGVEYYTSCRMLAIFPLTNPT